jgi:hypothetical protein
MSVYEVKLSGCDDSTTFAMELADAEAELLKRCRRSAGKPASASRS